MATVSTKSHFVKSADLVPAATAGKMLGVSDSRIRQLVGNHSKKAIKAIRFGQRSWMIAVSDLEKYAKEHEITLKYGPFPG